MLVAILIFMLAMGICIGLLRAVRQDRSLNVQRKTLEINPTPPVISDLLTKVKANKEDAAATARYWRSIGKEPPPPAP